MVRDIGLWGGSGRVVKRLKTGVSWIKTEKMRSEKKRQEDRYAKGDAPRSNIKGGHPQRRRESRGKSSWKGAVEGDAFPHVAKGGINSSSITKKAMLNSSAFRKKISSNRTKGAGGGENQPCVKKAGVD